MAKRKRHLWTTQDIKAMKTMARYKRPAWHIAKKLKRTENAVRQKAFSIDLSLETRQEGGLCRTTSFISSSVKFAYNDRDAARANARRLRIALDKANKRIEKLETYTRAFIDGRLIRRHDGSLMASHGTLSDLGFSRADIDAAIEYTKKETST